MALWLLNHPERWRESCETFGRDRIVVGIDAKDGEVMVRGWEQHGKMRAVELARSVAGAGVVYERRFALREASQALKH